MTRSDPLADGAHDDVSRGFHEHHFKERQNVAAGVVSRPRQEKALASQKPPQALAQKEMIERWRPTQVSGRGIDGHAPYWKA